MTYSIYALVDPRDSQTRYIGQTCNPKDRLYQHRSQAPGLVSTSAWLADLRDAGYKPVMVIMQQVPTLVESFGAEAYWIRHFIELGAKLLNVQNGVKRRPKQR